MEPYIAFLIGAYLIFIAVKNPDYFYYGRVISKVVGVLGRKNTRILYFLLGVFFICSFLWHIGRPFVR